MRRAAALLLGFSAAALAVAAEPPEAHAERAQIQHERAAAEALFRQTEAECKQRFAVSGCVEDAQAQRRKTLAALRERELALDEAKRKAEAEENTRRLEAKQAEAASRPPPVPRPASAAAEPLPPVFGNKTYSERVRDRSKTADEAAAAAERAAAQQRRADQAAAHRKEVEQRNAERAARGKKSQPLPVPSAASVAAIASDASR